MSFWKSLFGGTDEPSAEMNNNESADERQFDLMKYDGLKAMRIGQFEYAVKCFREALKVHDDLETRDYLQQSLTRLGLIREALEELTIMAKAEPDNFQLPIRMAHLAYLEEDYALMATYCQQAEGLDKDNASAQYLFAEAFIGQGDLINGIARLTKSIALDGDFPDARLLRGQTLLKMGDLKGCEEDTAWLEQNTNDQEDVLLLRARLEVASGRVDEAITAYGRVIDANPFHIDAFRERGKLYFDKGDKAHAEEDMQKLLELSPNETADVSGDYSAEGVEQQMKRTYSNMNPFGI